MKRLMSAAAILACVALSAQNPYMPLWEYIPDGEPYVFEDPDCPGKYRVYVYGSHDIEISAYCGRDQVVWSAPVEDLTDWRYDGVIFKSDVNAKGNSLLRSDILYAPDVAVRDGKYYLYPNNQAGGRQSMMCVSDRPDGPFTVYNWSTSNPRQTDGILGFDPAVFVDDDGRVYGYWGFEESNGAELDPVNMASVKAGTQIVKNMVSDYKHEGIFRFFEASSMRKIGGKYVFVYSRYTADGEDGLPASNNTLAYAYSDNPLGPFTYGGTIVDARQPDVDAQGNAVATANRYGNTHGSIIEIDGQWYVFYHRQTGTDQFSRQAMVAPITVKVTKDKVEISRAEVTSEGFQLSGLNPLNRIEAGWACWFKHPTTPVEDYPNFKYSGSYIRATRLEDGTTKGAYSLKGNLCPLTNNTAGSIVGWKYLNFDKLKKAKNPKITLHIGNVNAKGSIHILVGAPTEEQGGRHLVTFSLGSTDIQDGFYTIPLNNFKGIKGKKGLYMQFASDTKDVSICDLYDFQFTTD